MYNKSAVHTFAYMGLSLGYNLLTIEIKTTIFTIGFCHWLSNALTVHFTALRSVSLWLTGSVTNVFSMTLLCPLLPSQASFLLHFITFGIPHTFMLARNKDELFLPHFHSLRSHQHFIIKLASFCYSAISGITHCQYALF